MGSCFTEVIGEIMKELQFRIDVNPFGVNYNPSSVARNIWTLMNSREYSLEDLHSHEGRWFSYDHHSRFSDPDPEFCLQRINHRIDASRKHLEKTNFLLLTWGTAWVYVHRKTANVVSNCHKMPASHFSRHLLTVNQIVDMHTKLFAALRKNFPDLRIILTVSPVRHWKDGPELNSVSKSTLILAAHSLQKMFSYCEYFPAWEIAMDDLRDYRFYAEDLLHPNRQMIQYIWEKFSGAWLDRETFNITRQVEKLINAMKHRPFEPGSAGHLAFLEKQLEKTASLTAEYPFLDLSRLEDYFKSSLTSRK
jgi:hypothetical protein